MLETEPQYVFLDTNIFVGAAFNMESRDLSALEHLVAHGSVALMVTDIVVREVYSRITEEVRAAHAQHERFRKQSNVRVLRSGSSSRHVMTGVDPEKLESELRSDFDDYLARNKAAILSSMDLRAGPVLTDYFDKKPPFGEGEKRKEFPDAFSLAAIRAWLEENKDESVVVVTSDVGMAEGLKGLESVEHVSELRTLLDKVHSSDEPRGRFLKSEILKQREALLSLAKEAFTDRGFYVRDRWESDVLEVRVKSVEMTDDAEDLDIVEAGASTATIVTLVSVEFDADLRYGDESMMSYDSEEGSTYYWNHIEETVNERRDDLELEIQVSFEGFNPEGFAVEGVAFNFDSLSIETSEDRAWRRGE